MSIQELLNKRASIYDQAKAILDERTQENGLLTAEDEKIYDNMMDEMDKLSAQIKRLEDAAAREKHLNAPTTTAVTGKVGGQVEDKDARYQEEFRAAILRGQAPITNFLKESSDADGGYLVPTEMNNQIIVDLADYNVFRQIANVITTSHDREMPMAATHSVAKWTAEGAKATESNPTFGNKTIKAHKATDLIKVTDELLQDSAFNIDNYVAAEIARAFGTLEEEAFCVGTGTGQPTGLFTDNGGTVGVTAAANNAIAYDEVLDLVYSVIKPYRAKGSFLTHDTTVKSLRKLKDNQGQYLWQPSLQAGEPDRLAGYRVYTSPFVPVMAADALALAFGDMKQYTIADRKRRSIKRLSELYAESGMVGFLATQRVDGLTIYNDGIKLLKMKNA